ncbi:hypothetical protein KR009_006653, partial [Drosophila setifemur]
AAHPGKDGKKPTRERDSDYNLRHKDSGSGTDNDSIFSESDVHPVDHGDDPNTLRFGIMADAEVTLGFLLAGIGYHREKFRNYMMVDSDTPQEELVHFFNALYRRPNIGIIIIDHETSHRLRNIIQKCNQVLPILLTVPAKASLLSYLEKKDRKRRLRQRDAY